MDHGFATGVCPTLGPAALRHFRRRGWVRIPGAFPPSDAQLLRELIWAELGRRHGIRRDAPATWNRSWSGLQPLGRRAAFRAIATARLAGALDQLSGRGRWRWPRSWSMFLVDPPRDTPGAWRVPMDGWHYDALPGPILELNAFIFYDQVVPRGGGTLLLDGSHQLLAHFLAQNGRALAGRSFRARREAFAAHHPWLRRLHGIEPGRTARGLELLGSEPDAQEAGLLVREMTGAAGDVILWCAWMYHVRPSHHLHRPRLMSNVRVPAVRSLTPSAVSGQRAGSSGTTQMT